MTAEYLVLFDIRDQPFHALGNVVFGFLASISAFGFGWWTDQQVARYFSYFIGSALLIAALVSSTWDWKTYTELQSAMRRGDYVQIEGVVENFRSDVADGGPQSFTLQDQRFSFYRADSTPAFHRTELAGGPNLAGQCVSIAHTRHNEILRLAIKTSGCGEQAQ